LGFFLFFRHLVTILTSLCSGLLASQICLIPNLPGGYIVTLLLVSEIPGAETWKERDTHSKEIRQGRLSGKGRVSATGEHMARIKAAR
jgi:hypothetical protein